MLTAVALALILQQVPPQVPPAQSAPVAAGQGTWSEPVEAPAEAPKAALPALPDWARADPYGYERSECSPLIRKASEPLETCQSRVRATLAANLGAALPADLGGTASAEQCRQEADGDRYALQCGSPAPAGAPIRQLVEQTCETRPSPQPGGGIGWVETCRPADGRAPEREGLRIKLGGD